MNQKDRYFKSKGLLLTALIIVNLIIVLISFLYYEIERKAFLNQQVDQLKSIEDMKINLIAMSGLMMLAFTSTLSFFWLKQRNEVSILKIEKKMLIERFDLLSKFSNDAIIICTQDLTILQVNDKALELYGYEREEMLGMSIELLGNTETRPGMATIYQTTIRDGGSRFDTLHVRKDGTVFPVEVSLRFVELMGSPCFQALVRDITQRKQFEKALIASEERLRLITNTMPQIVWTARPDGSFDFVNSRFEVLTGAYPLKESATTDFIHENDRVHVISYWRNAIHDIREHQVSFRIRMKDGSFRWFLCLAIPMCNDKGEVIRWYGSATDIDELENRVKQRTEELEAFTYSVSHDLRAPLRAINGFSQILLDDYKGKLDQEARNMLDKVWMNANRMRQLIDDLLRLSRTGRQELSYTKIDMHALFNSIVEEIRQLNPERIINVVINEMPKANGDLSLLKQVISNLLSNAVKFSAEKAVSEIEIGSSNCDEMISYFVKDNGIGFDMKFEDELFGVFRRLHNADEYEGTGVGLALVKRIIDKHGGRVWANSQPGNGATFYFSLPLTK